MALFELAGRASVEFHDSVIAEVSLRLNHKDNWAHRSAVGALARIAGTGSAAAIAAVMPHAGLNWADTLREGVQRLKLLHRQGSTTAIAALVASLRHIDCDVRAVAVQ